jgi:hypothetical protein
MTPVVVAISQPAPFEVRPSMEVWNRRPTPRRSASVTSPSRTSLARFERGNSFPVSASSARGTPTSFSKKCTMRGSGQARSMPRIR